MTHPLFNRVGLVAAQLLRLRLDRSHASVGLLLSFVLWLSPASVIAATPLSPERIPDLGLWLNASTLKSHLSDGAPVLRWPDSSANGYEAVFEPIIPQVKSPAHPYGNVPQEKLHAGRHQPPTFRSEKSAPYAAVSFEASKRQTLVLNFPGHALGQDVAGFTTTFMVRVNPEYGPSPVPDVEWGPNRFLFISHLSDYTTRLSVQIETKTGKLRINSRALPGQKITTLSATEEPRTPVVSGSSWHRLLIAVDYRRKTVSLLLDGAEFSYKLPPDSGDMAEDVPSPITGIGSNTLGEWINCDLAELVCYQKALSHEEMLGLDQYFQAKYPLAH